MKRKWCSLPAATKKKYCKGQGSSFGRYWIIFYSKTLLLLQGSEILWPIHLICICCRAISRCALIENGASSTVSYQTACRVFLYGIALRCRNFQFKVFPAINEQHVDFMTPWPTVIKNKIKTIYNDSAGADVPDVCVVDAQRLYTPSSAHSSQGGRLCLWKQLYHTLNSGGVLTCLKNWFSGLRTTIFFPKNLGLESLKDMAFIRQWVELWEL